MSTSFNEPKFANMPDQLFPNYFCYYPPVYKNNITLLTCETARLSLEMWNNKSVTGPSVCLCLNADWIVKTIKRGGTNDCRMVGVVPALPQDIRAGYGTPPSLTHTHTGSVSALSGDDNRSPQWVCDCISALIPPLIAGDRQGCDNATFSTDAGASCSPTAVWL